MSKQAWKTEATPINWMKLNSEIENNNFEDALLDDYGRKAMGQITAAFQGSLSRQQSIPKRVFG
jgi:hypothetical protein